MHAARRITSSGRRLKGLQEAEPTILPLSSLRQLDPIRFRPTPLVGLVHLHTALLDVEDDLAGESGREERLKLLEERVVIRL